MMNPETVIPLFNQEWLKLEEAGFLDSIGSKQYRRLFKAWAVDDFPMPVDKWLGLMVSLQETMVTELTRLYKERPELVKVWDLKEPGKR
jgi:hypothetical protein